MKKPSSSGYSGTPLAKKLGYKPDDQVVLVNPPGDFLRQLHSIPRGVTFVGRPSPTVDLIHVFVTQRDDLAKHLIELRRIIKPDAMLWISWPKKASKVPTTVTEDTIRELALPLGLVDIKICAVDDIWSGLKLVIRKELR